MITIVDISAGNRMGPLAEGPLLRQIPRVDPYVRSALQAKRTRGYREHPGEAGPLREPVNIALPRRAPDRCALHPRRRVRPVLYPVTAPRPGASLPRRIVAAVPSGTLTQEITRGPGADTVLPALLAAIVLTIEPHPTGLPAVLVRTICSP